MCKISATKPKYIYFNRALHPGLSTKLINFLTFKLLIGKLTKDGNRAKARRILEDVILLLKGSNTLGGADLLFHAVYIAMPFLRLINKRVGGVIYKLPVPILGFYRSISIAVKTLVVEAGKRHEQGIRQKLFHEILDTYHKRSETYKAKIYDYSVATNNLPFLHYIKKKRIRSFMDNFNFYKLRAKYTPQLFRFKPKEITTLRFVRYTRRRRWKKLFFRFRKKKIKKKIRRRRGRGKRVRVRV